MEQAAVRFATKAGGTELTTKDVTRWLTDAGGIFGKLCSSNNLDIAFSKIKQKGRPTITAEEMPSLIAEIAKAYASDKKCTVAEAIAQITEKLEAAQPLSHKATKQSVTGNVDHFTDVSGYTGSHKERFDAETGKGKGLDGREYKNRHTGYVGAYKGAGTYDKIL